MNSIIRLRGGNRYKTEHMGKQSARRAGRLEHTLLMEPTPPENQQAEDSGSEEEAEFDWDPDDDVSYDENAPEAEGDHYLDGRFFEDENEL
jgi:hypothetical protein